MKASATFDRAEDCGYQISAIMRVVQAICRSYDEENPPSMQLMSDLAMLCEVAEDLADECQIIIETEGRNRRKH